MVRTSSLFQIWGTSLRLHIVTYLTAVCWRLASWFTSSADNTARRAASRDILLHWELKFPRAGLPWISSHDTALNFLWRIQLACFHSTHTDSSFRAYADRSSCPVSKTGISFGSLIILVESSNPTQGMDVHVSSVPLSCVGCCLETRLITRPRSPTSCL
jgi:hypothetical protein